LKQKNYNKYLENKAVAEMENIKVNRDEIKPPPPPPPPPEIKQVQFRAPVIVDTLSNPEVELGTTDDLSKIANTAMVDTVQQTIEIVDDADPVIETPMEIYAIQEKPAFPGGEAALLAYISKEIKYPVMAQENGVEGTVYIRFVVTKSGDVGEVQLMSSADPLLDNEAMRVIRTLPRWSPGKYNGNAVNVWFVVPIKFALQN
jgi:protein TonB